MNLDSQTIARFIFLLFIVSISVYFMFANHEKTIEKFDDKQTPQDKTDFLPQDKDKLEKTVKDIFIEINLPTPSQKAVDFYVDFAYKRSITRDDFKEVIEGSAQALEKTLKDSSGSTTPPTPTFGTEDEVEEAYNEILFRNPDDTELYNFAKLLKTDSTFSLEKLKQILYASEEYMRMEKTQDNRVYSNLMGGVTDRQLNLIVTTVYKDVTGEELNDTDTTKFLKKKLLQLNLDEDQFKKFVSMYIQGKPFEPDMKTKDEQADILQKAIKQSVAAKAAASGQISEADFQKFKADVLDEIKRSMQNIPKPQQEQNPNKQVIEVLLKTAKDSQKEDYLDSQSVLDTIKKEAKCVFNKDAMDNQYAMKGPNQDMARLLDKRNTDELKNTCVRNQKFLGVDEDMVLDPSLRWSVPQRHPPVCVGGANKYQPVLEQTALIGTLLADAQDTEVGSILPEVPPR